MKNRISWFVLALFATACGDNGRDSPVAESAGAVTVTPAGYHDVSPPLGSLPPAPEITPTVRREKKKFDLPLAPGSPSDPVIQSSAGSAAAPALGLGFDGVGNGFTGPSGTFTVNSAPPDTAGAVGPNHYFQVVNSAIAIFDKTGRPIYGPVPTNTLWSGFGGGCQTNNDGDAVIEYDRLADRWVVTQFSVTAPFPNEQCVAVSTTGDPTGSYFRYSFGYANFPDYPKLAVWPDAYTSRSTSSPASSSAPRSARTTATGCSAGSRRRSSASRSARASAASSPRRSTEGLLRRRARPIT